MTDVIHSEPDNHLSQNLEGYGFFTRVSDSQLFAKIKARTDARKHFTDRVTSERVSVRLSDIALVISPNGTLALVSHVRPTRVSTTGTRAFKANGSLSVNLTVEELVDASAAEVHAEIIHCFKEPAIRPSLLAWQEIWAGIKRLRPQFSAELRHIEQLRFDDSFTFDSNSDDERLFYEKDAVGVALNVAGISFGGVFAELSESRGKADVDDRDFLRALCGDPIEDVVINHDVHNFPEYIPTTDRLSACEFSQNGRKLTVYNVNRRDGERALGVDLIYQNISYNAFTFVQYKMLEREGSAQAPVWRYRPDSQFDAEIARMRAAQLRFRNANPTESDLFRFGEDPFFFKLCRRQNLKVNSGQLISGAYINLSHCNLILTELHGKPRVFEPGASVKRWLTRTHFSELVAKGWIGTNNLTSNDLQNYISEALAARRSVLIAVGDSQINEGGSDDSG